MVNWCLKYRVTTEVAKLECSERCNQCDSYSWLSEYDYKNWLRKKIPSRTATVMTKTTPPSQLPKKPQIIEWKLIDANVIIHAKEGEKKQEFAKRSCRKLI